MQRILIHRGCCRVYIHTAAIVFTAYLIITGNGILLLTAYPSILLHEAAHMAVANLLGLKPDEIEITPLGAMMRLSWQGTARWKRLCILLAGPAVTMLVCLLCIRCAEHGVISASVGRMLFCANASILMINLLPCYPLDGGGMIALLLSSMLPDHTASKVMRAIGTVVGAVLVLLALYCGIKGLGMNLSLVFAGCMLVYAAYSATTSESLHILKGCMERKTAIEQQGTLRMESVAVLEQTSVVRALRMLHERRYTQFIILESGTMRLIDVISESDLIAAALKSSSDTCGSVAQKKTGKPCNP